MKETLQNTDDAASKLIEELQKENAQLNGLLKHSLLYIKELKERLSIYEMPNGTYNKSWTVITKIVFLITQADKPLRSSEIITLLRYREPSLINERQSVEKYISAFLNTAMKHGRLIPYKLKGVRGNYYCIPEWMDEKSRLVAVMRVKIF